MKRMFLLVLNTDLKDLPSTSKKQQKVVLQYLSWGDND